MLLYVNEFSLGSVIQYKVLFAITVFYNSFLDGWMPENIFIDFLIMINVMMFARSAYDWVLVSSKILWHSWLQGALIIV